MISLAEFAKWYLTYISGQPYSRLTFATELLLAEILFMWPYKRSRLFGVRAAASFLLYVAIAYFFPEAALHMGSYVTILVFVCSVALHALCSGYSFKKVAFNCIAAYAVQNFIVNLRICIMGTFAISESYRIVVELCCAVAVFAGAYLLFARKNSREEADNLQYLRDTQRAMGWQLLDNSHVILHHHGDSIALIGVENDGEPPFPQHADLAQATEGTEEMFSILLSHNPTHWRREVLPESDIDLMLAGHTHAMQMTFFGRSLSSLKYPEWSGMYYEGPRALTSTWVSAMSDFPSASVPGPRLPSSH